MNGTTGRLAALVGCAAFLATTAARTQDWPQWCGANRDAKATGFPTPKTWPKELVQKWKVAVGDGVASPSLVGNKLYVFALDGGNEVLRCLDAASDKEFKEIAKYKVAEGSTYGYPIVAGNRVFVKDRDSVAMWTIE
jgi:hypothetical protein